jgi:hypothetical protein
MHEVREHVLLLQLVICGELNQRLLIEIVLLQDPATIITLVVEGEEFYNFGI